MTLKLLPLDRFLPCPYCGGKIGGLQVGMGASPYYHDDYDWHFVFSCNGGDEEGNEWECPINPIVEGTLEECIAKMNSRVEQPYRR